MQETRVWSLTPGGAHMPWNNWARAPQLLSLCSRAQKLQLLSPRATTTDAQAPGTHAPQREKPPQWGAHTLQLESSLRLPQLEKSQPAPKTQYSQKKNLSGQQGAEQTRDEPGAGLPWWLGSERLACNAGDPSSIPGLGRSPGEGNGNPLCILAWRIPWTEEPGMLQSMGLQRVRHNWATELNWWLIYLWIFKS